MKEGNIQIQGFFLNITIIEAAILFNRMVNHSFFPDQETPRIRLQEGGELVEAYQTVCDMFWFTTSKSPTRIRLTVRFTISTTVATRLFETGLPELKHGLPAHKPPPFGDKST
ncbi:hypothetical protein ACJX0J_010485, partial [Zea mays]